MKQFKPVSVRAGSMLGASVLALHVLGAQALASEPTLPPDPPKFDAQSKIVYVSPADILEFKALPTYHEPDWVTANFVDKGKLPPVKDRLPKEPLVYKVGNMPDGIGVYGDTMRHVIGGRPEGWNFAGGQTQGWGGIDIAMSECLTRTAPLFQVKPEELKPLPNLAKSWEWSGDGHTLTMHLLEGAKWSDGVPFSSEDLVFFWEDNIGDRNVTPMYGPRPETFGADTKLKAIDATTVEWTFKEAFPKQVLFAMSFGTFCPGPAHILKPQHPKYSKNTYDQYKNAFKADYMNMPVMGAWVPVTYRPDDIIVLRRNPYYWKVDEAGNQLPYLNEMHFKLSTWADRDVQAVAGSGDFSNLEQTESFVESLKRSAQASAPARLDFGPRIIGYQLDFNLSGNGWGDPDKRAQAVRDLNRNEHFRKAITMAVDREKLGQSLVKGPFTTIYPGGLMPGLGFYDKASTTYYPYDLAGAKAELALAGLKDTDGDGVVNFPAGVADGKNVEVTLLITSSYQTDKSLGEGIVAAMEALGIRVIVNLVDSKQRDALYRGGQFDWMIFRNPNSLISVVQNTSELAPVGPRTSYFHRAPEGKDVDLLPFEKELVDKVNKFSVSNDAAERFQLMKDYQKIFTSNVYAVGLVTYPGALIINKRFANVPPGTPIVLYNWAEDAIIRERVFVPAAKQAKYELHPMTLPGVPGSAGPVN